MVLVNFRYEGKITVIECSKKDKMLDICKKYVSEKNKDIDINSLYFLYQGEQIDNEKTFDEQATNPIDKERQAIDIFVYNINDLYVIQCPNCRDNIKNYNNNFNNMLSELKKHMENINNIINENNFDIKVKKPIHIIQAHEEYVSCATVLNDGRLATCSGDKSIIIYNKEKFNPELIINEHYGYVRYILKLSSGRLASCSDDKTIKIFNIFEKIQEGIKNYEILQELKAHNDSIYKIIELENQKLVSCSDDQKIIIYSKGYEYKKEKEINTNGSNFCVIQTKINEICYYVEKGYNEGSIYFYDFNENEIRKVIEKISRGGMNFFHMIKEDLLLITGNGKISIINVNKYNIVNEIDIKDSSFINVACMLNENIILTGDYNKKIIQWRLEDDNLILISKKENAHNDEISALIKLDNGHILSGSYSGEIKIW